jgi:hypothetical protein
MFQGSRPHRSRKDPKARPNCAGSSGIGYVRSRRVGGTTRLLGTAQSAKSVTWTVAFIRPLLSAQGMRAWLSPRSESLQNQEPAPLRKHTECTFGVRHRGCLTGKPCEFFPALPIHPTRPLSVSLVGNITTGLSGPVASRVSLLQVVWHREPLHPVRLSGLPPARHSLGSPLSLDPIKAFHLSGRFTRLAWILSAHIWQRFRSPRRTPCTVLDRPSTRHDPNLNQARQALA